MNVTQEKQLTAAIRNELERPVWQFKDLRADGRPDNIPGIFIVRRAPESVSAEASITVETKVSEYRYCGRDFAYARAKYIELCAAELVRIVRESDLNAELERRRKK